MKAKLLVICSILLISGCGESSNQAQNNGGPASTINYPPDIVPAGKNMELESANLSIVIFNMSKHIDSNQSKESVARMFEEIYSINCNPLCTVKRR